MNNQETIKNKEPHKFYQLLRQEVVKEDNLFTSLFSTEIDFNDLSLTLDSTLKDLFLYHVRAEISILGENINYLFNKYKTLPGVIITENNNFLGVISRRKFLEQMSRPYGIDLFFKRPLQSLYKFIPNHPLVLSHHTLIVDATQQVLERPFDLIDEPIVVILNSGEPCLLDVKQLLIAYSTIHQLATKLLTDLALKLEYTNHQLEELVNIDALTQLANRRYFNFFLQQEWKRLQRKKQPISLLICDVDYFKRYNDTYGHLQGDWCLQKVAKVIKESAQRSTDLSARYGGEEFAIILPDTDINGAFSVARNLQENLKNCQIIHQSSEVSNYVTLSIGVACLVPSLEQTEEILIQQADQALYQSKRKGRDTINIFSSDLLD